MDLMKGLTLDFLMMVFLFMLLVTFLGATSTPATVRAKDKKNINIYRMRYGPCSLEPLDGYT